MHSFPSLLTEIVLAFHPDSAFQILLSYGPFFTLRYTPDPGAKCQPALGCLDEVSHAMSPMDSDTCSDLRSSVPKGVPACLHCPANDHSDQVLAFSSKGGIFC